jgi:hypothetical protein
LFVQAAFEDRIDVQPAPNLAHIDRLPFELKRQRARHHAEIGPLRQFVGKFVGQTVRSCALRAEAPKLPMRATHPNTRESARFPVR